jgi:NAD(P)H-hydrate epimerase
VIPVLTGEEMRAVDAAAPDPVEVLIQRAGAAVARVALEEMGGAYGRRVVVVAGKGNNGADGRAAAAMLRRRGVRVAVLDAAIRPDVLPPCDLVIDAAYGTGFRGTYEAPDPGDAIVLAVDVPSGSVRADVTVTFAALKPQLVFDRGAAGAVSVADIGLDVSAARMAVFEAGDVAARLPRRPRDAHKYWAAVGVIAGSPGMTGAASLTSMAALRAGAGYCRLGIPGGDVGSVAATEVVAVPLPASGWAPAAVDAADRMKAMAIGPGLGRTDATAAACREAIAGIPVPLVVDADGLFALGGSPAAVLAERPAPTILTPHDGEFARLAGEAPAPAGMERVDAVRALADRAGATVLLKGPTTVVAAPGGEVRFARLGTPALATAGTGDVLTGVVAAFLAAGLAPLLAAGLAATAHGAAARAGHRVGLVASDLLDLIPAFLSGEPR